MTATVSLTLKIDPELKETLKAIALENQTTLSEEVSRRLRLSLETAAEDVQSDAQEEDDRLSAAEVKQIRTLLKKSKKKK